MQSLRFDYTVEEITEQIQKTITINKAFIDKVESIPIDACTFDNVCHYLATNNGDMSIITGPMTFLQHVSMDEKIREASRAYEKAMKDFDAIVYQRPALYERYKQVLSDLGRQLADSSDLPKMSKEKIAELKVQYRFTQNIVHEFELNGAQLDEVDKIRVKNLINQRTEMEQKFTENIAEVDAFLIFKESELDGCPADFLDRTRIEGTKTHKITYKYPDIIGIKTRCSNANTRKKVQTMAYTRCPQNMKILADLLRVRNKIAKIIGYDSHPDLQASDQIVMNGENARKLLESLIEKLAPHVKQYTNKLCEIKKNDPNRRVTRSSVDEPLEWHDFDYYHERNLADNYSVDNNYVREFFPSEFVLDQVFDFYSNLFGLRFEKYAEKMWHADVLSFRVYSRMSDKSDMPDEILIGAFHLDLYPREGKYNHYAMWDLLPGYQTMNNMVESAQQVLPIATMVCNFTAPVFNSDGTVLRPSLLELNEVETLFHEFGHVMHGICGGYKNKYYGQGGTNTEVDFVEAPSQMLENWLYEYSVLKKISKHYQTGEPLSDDIIQKIKASQTVGVAREWARIAGMALADQVIHASSIPDAIRFTPLAIKKQMCNVMKSSLIMQPPADYGDMLGEWAHIGDDQYSARYYSYTLTRLLASDMYSIFKKANNDAVMGRKYRELILERGGTHSGLSMVTEFLGRKPSMYAFLNDTCGIPKSQLVGNMELEFKSNSPYETTF